MVNSYRWRGDVGANEWDCGCLQHQDGVDRCPVHIKAHGYPWDGMVEPAPIAPVASQPTTTEIRVTDPTTGGQKGKKPEAYGLMPVGPLAEVARVYGYGEGKYASRNWEKGYSWRLSYDALQRHVNEFWAGRDTDVESGLNHLAHAVFHCFALMEWQHTHPEKDDRPK